MRPFAAAALFVLASSAATAHAQETVAPAPVKAEEQDDADEQDDEQAAAPRRHIQVLDHPYAISSFYRSSQGSGAVELGYEPEGASVRYPIASFYRSRGGAPGGYSMFWTAGYDSSRARGRSRDRGRGLIGAGRPRALGLNGDLCLFAPTFLAGVGPLTGVFFER